MRIETRDAWARDVDPMLEVVRPMDREEWAAAGGTPMSAYLHYFIQATIDKPLTHLCKITLADHQPMMMWGVVPEPGAPGTGRGWMIASVHAYAVQWQLHKATLYWLDGVYEQTGYERLVCSVYDRNLYHHRWVEWLGFKATGVRPTGPLDIPFVDYERTA